MSRRSITLLAVATLAAAGAATPAHAAHEYSVDLCATDTAGAGLWQATGPLTANNRGVECPGNGSEPGPYAATGPRGVYVLQHNSGTISSAGDPSAALTLTVPSGLSVTSGSVAYRGGADSRAWRAWVRADGQTLAGCFPDATSGVEACAYDYLTIFYKAALSASIPAGTTTLSVGVTCGSVDALGAANSGCAGSNPATANRTYSAITSGYINVSDATAPTGSATLTQTTAAGTPATWTRSSDARLRVSDVNVSDAGRGVCRVRVQRVGEDPSFTALREWTATTNRASFHQCATPDVSGSVDVSSVREGVRQFEIVAIDSPQLDGARTTLGTATLRTDDTAPTIDYAQVPASGAPGSRVRVAPAITDDGSGVATSSTTATDDAGRPVTIDDGNVTLPATGSVTVSTTATDTVGNTATQTRTITVVVPPVDPPPTTPTTPEQPPTPTTPTTPTTTTTPTVPPGPPAPVPSPKPTGCAAATRSSVKSAKLTRKTRRLTLTGCRYGGQALRVEVRVRRGRRTITRTYTLAGRSSTWKRTLRLRTGETPRKTRLLLPRKKHTAWRTVR